MNMEINHTYGMSKYVVFVTQNYKAAEKQLKPRNVISMSVLINGFIK